jgi:site-specific recombinase XerD
VLCYATANAPLMLVIGKGDKERLVFFDSETQEHIRAYLEARADTLARCSCAMTTAEAGLVRRVRTGGSHFSPSWES